MRDASVAIARLLSPRSVAVIGASADASKTSGRPVAYLQKHGFTGRILPVNPKVARLGDLVCYPDVSSLPEVPDVAIVLLGAERAHLAVKELAATGCSAAIVLASGYGETGEAGSLRQKELIQAAGPMRLLGPNTIGLVNLSDGIVLSASGALEMDAFPVGDIGIVSQSGGILGSLLSRAAARGIGLSKLISTSNEADLELADFVSHLADDPATRVIALYVETVRRAEAFRASCLKAARAGKPVVAFKVGRSDAGARAAASHTGALAGTDAMYEALFRDVGVIRATTFSDLLDMPAALATGRRLKGRRIAVLTSTGGAGTLVSDDLGIAGFDTPAPDMATAGALRALHSGSEAVLDRNPIDVTLAGLRPDLLRNAIRTLVGSPGYDALVVIVGSSSLAQPELMAGAIQDCLPVTEKPVMAYISPHAPEVGALLMRLGVPAFASAESCTAALRALLHADSYRPMAETPAEGPVLDMAELRVGNLDESEAKQLFARFGVAGVSERIVTSSQEAVVAARELGGRVVLKVLSSAITHKSDVGGVAVEQTPESIGDRLGQMATEIERRTGVRPLRFLVQAMVTKGTELILGLRRDALGTFLLLGMGGVTAELFQDTAMRLLPADGSLSREEALAMARELRMWPLLDGFRGRPKCDVGALVDAMVGFSSMAARLGDRLVEAEINPLFVLPEGRGACAADGVVVLAGPVDGIPMRDGSVFPPTQGATTCT
jgi:acyl-CoA synthetase (NDP forming)